MEKILLIIATLLLVLSCKKEPNYNDPQGTIIVEVDEYNRFLEISINEADNFYSDPTIDWQFCNLGEVNGLGNITTIPTSGYTAEVPIRVCNGYIGRRVYTPNAIEYVAFYVDSYKQAAPGKRAVATIRYLHPFKPNTYGGGDGTESSPYIINTEAQLRAMHPIFSENITDIYFKLGKNIELTSDWIPLCLLNTNCNFYFDGDGHTISNLSINLPQQEFVGLCLGTQYILSVKNLNLILAPKGIIGGDYVGGIIGGCARNTIISNCSIIGNITGNNYVGGIVGFGDWEGNITNCSVMGNITGNNYVGGIIGDGNVDISYSLFAGKLMAKSYFGGVTGDHLYSTITSCYFDKTLAGTEIAVGGTTDTTGALTTEQMKQKASFVGWDFETIWDIDEGVSYPFLR